MTRERDHDIAKTLKTISTIGGGIGGVGAIVVILWFAFLRDRVCGEINAAWPTQRQEVIKIADSTTQTYTDDLYDKVAQSYFNQQEMMTAVQKARAKQAYDEYCQVLKKRRRTR